MPFDKGELLRQAGYSSGDVLPLITATSPQTRQSTVSSTTFQLLFDNMNPQVPSEIDPDDGQLVLGHVNNISVGADETVTARVRDIQPGAAVTGTEITTSSSGPTFSGFADLSLANPNGVNDFTIEMKTEPAVNSSSSRSPILIFGVRL